MTVETPSSGNEPTPYPVTEPAEPAEPVGKEIIDGITDPLHFVSDTRTLFPPLNVVSVTKVVFYGVDDETTGRNTVVWYESGSQSLLPSR